MKYIPFAVLLCSQLSFAQNGLFWENPLPQGNSLSSVSFSNPDTGTAVGLNGTMLLTNDGGGSWTSVSSGTTNSLFGVSWHGNMGVAVGLNGTILSTADGGASWTSEFSGTANALFGVSFSGSNRGTAVGLQGTILSTADGGASWTSVSSGTAYALYGVTFASVDNGTAVGLAGTILRTTDGGASWTSVSSGTTHALYGVSFAASNIGTAVGDSGTILRTTDGGASWTGESSGTTNALKCVFYADAFAGTAVGDGGAILHTTDGGASWTSEPSGTTGTLSGISFASVNRGTAVGLAGTILHTTDGGASWTNELNGLTNTLYGISIDPHTDVGMAVGVYGTLLYSSTTGLPSGVSWESRYSGTTHDLYSVSLANANLAIAVGHGGTIVHTSTGGASWVTQVSGTRNTLYGISFTPYNTATAVGDGGIILHTTDGGAHWTGQESGTLTTLYGVVFTDADTGTAVGQLGTILRTTNGGKSWTSQASGTTNALRGVSFAALGRSGMAVGVNGTILYTSDGGANWTGQSSGTTNALFGVTFGGDVGEAVGLNGTILYTPDRGAHWTNESAPTTNALYGIMGGAGTVVGQFGTILGGSSDFTPAFKRISGTVFNDLNHNGAQDPGENGLSGWTINLTGPAGHSTFTDVDGYYHFDNLDPGTYTVTEIQKPRWKRSKPPSGSYIDTVSGTSQFSNQDFGNYMIGTIRGVKFYDSDEDGSKDGGEPLLGNWRIRLVKNGIQIDSTFTTPAGYQFNNLDSGTYLVREQLPPGWIQTYPPQAYHTVVLGIDDSISGIGTDFGNYYPYTDSRAAGWNMVSVPVAIPDYRKSVLYPTAISRAFAYKGSYTSEDTLQNGPGYWMKFAQPETLGFAGRPILEDTFDVVSGWNMIGSISVPIVASSMTSIPPGIKTTPFFGYLGSYFIADTIRPGKGYWMKAGHGGSIILSSGSSSGEAARVRIIPTSELPPAPPPGADVVSKEIPAEFALEQNFPNPFNPLMAISYSIPRQSRVRLQIFNPLGQLIATLVDESRPPGRYTATWDASNRSSGLYFYRMTAGDFSQTKKALFIR
jgi:photosystem II stability/assembly factor-like uncharacterized protein